MRKFTKTALLLSLLLATTFSFSSEAIAWGDKGHRIVTYVGAKLTQGDSKAFWSSNADGLKQLSTLPDEDWKLPATKKGEANTHWFQADAYISDLNQCADLLNFPKAYKDAVSKYGQQAISKNGTANWRIAQMYQLASEALAAGYDRSAIEYAGIMSHYVADLSMPFHVTGNYDGQKTGNQGIHAYFEINIIEDELNVRAEVQRRAELLLQDKVFLKDNEGDLADIVYHEIIRSLLARDKVLEVDDEYGRNSKKGAKIQLDLAIDRMADGAATYALILAKLAKDSGKNGSVAPISVTQPPWIAPDYE